MNTQEKQQLETPPVPNEIEEVCKAWPNQVISNHEYWWKVWMDSLPRNYSRTSVVEMKIIGKRFAEFGNGRAINPRMCLDWHLHVLTFKGTKGGQFGPIRIRRYLTDLKRYLGWLTGCNIIKADPSRYMPSIYVPPPLAQKSFTHAEYLGMMRFAEGQPRFQTAAYLICLGYHTGMSLVDCCHLKWEEVTLRDDGPSFIQRIRTKIRMRVGARAMCTIPVLAGSEVWRWLKRLQADKPANAVHVHREAIQQYNSWHGKHLRERFTAVMAAGVGGKQNLNGRSFRNLRTSFTSRMVNSGSDSVLVSKMTGHQNLEQLAEYVVPDVRKMQECVHNALRWAEAQDMPPEPTPNIIALPSPPVTEKTGELPRLPTSLASEAGGAANSQTKNLKDTL